MAEVNSPCIRQCCLDEEDVCLGCGRHLKDILNWTALDTKGKREVLQQAASRTQARDRRLAKLMIGPD